jgi:hypothetical protein
MIFTYKNEEFSIVPFAQCPNCQQLIKLEIENEKVLTNSRNCPSCKVEIEESEIVLSFAGKLMTTAAMQSAGKILGFDAALLIFFGVVFLK